MDWTQFAILLITILALIWSLRSDIQQNRAEASADRRDMLQIMRCIESEIKDFHGRLCAIEERNRK